MTMTDETVTLDYDRICKDDPMLSAILIVFEDGDDEDDDLIVWIPRSQIVDHDEDERTITIPQWLAEAKGLV